MRFLVIAIGLLFLSNGSFAEDSSSGCGLGWKVVQRNSLLSSYTRTLTNATTSSTIAMTSGTSGCAQHSIVRKEQKELHYAEANFHSLMVEMAQGEGETLKGLALVMGCTPTQEIMFSEVAQKNYGTLFPETGSNPNHLVDAMRSSLNSENLCGSTEI